MEVVDCTPKWMGLFPLLKEFIMSGTEKQKRYVCDELQRLCEVVDRHNKDAEKEE